MGNLCVQRIITKEHIPMHAQFYALDQLYTFKINVVESCFKLKLLM